jgi:acetyl-CoA carboxylase carboxyltransferase component
MGAKSLGADVCLALESAKISAMEPKSAVSFLGLVDDESKHAEIAAEWAETNATPVAAARGGHIDDIISADELRMRIAAALEMLI